MSDIETLTDAELVAAYSAGDRHAFAAIYDRYASRIFSYHLTILRDREEAADATFDTFMHAAAELGPAGPDKSLRPWLFFMARETSRSKGTSETFERSGVGPETPPSEAGLKELVWAAAADLGERDQQLLALHLVEGLDGEDLATAMGVEPSHVQVMVSRMEDRVEKALGALLIARLGSDGCDELVALLEEGEGAFDAGVRGRVNRHVEVCETCRQRRESLLVPAKILPGILIVPAPPALRPRVLDRVDSGSVVAEAPSRPKATPDWAKAAIFVVVAVALGLLGFAVSARFEPLDPPATVPMTAPAEALPGSTTSTTGIGSTVSTEPSSPTTTTTSGAPAAIEVSTATVDFGSEGTTARLGISNGGGQATGWQLRSSTGALALSAEKGELAGGESVTIDLSLNREELEEGEIAETVTLTWAEGDIAIDVVGSLEDNPIIHNPSASPSTVEVAGNRSCPDTRTTVSARVRDTSALQSVVVRWSPGGGSQQETQMQPTGNDMFEAVIGPFTAVGTTEARIVAFDILGNAGGATTQVSVVACP